MESRVLSWTMQDLYQSVQDLSEIPLVFRNSRDYYDSFVYYFYQELKSVILQTLQSSQVLKIKQVSKVELGLEYSQINLSIQETLRKNDLVLLSKEFNVTQGCGSYLFGLVLNASDTTVVLQTILDENMEEYRLLKNPSANWELLRILNLESFSKVERALCKKLEFGLLKEIMDPQCSIQLFPDQELEQFREKLEKITLVTKVHLNENQVNSLLKALIHATNDKIYMISGSQATGKTLVITYMAILLLNEGKNVFLTAPDNMVLSEMVKRLVKLVNEFHFFQLNQLVLVNISEKFASNPLISSVLLEDRIGRILHSYEEYLKSWVKIGDLVFKAKDAFIKDETNDLNEPTDKALLKYAKENIIKEVHNVSGFIKTIVEELPDRLLQRINGIYESNEYFEIFQKKVEEAEHLQDIVDAFDENYEFMFQKFSFPIGKERITNWLRKELIDNARILLSTVNVAGRSMLKGIMSEKRYVVVVDEAAQVPEPDMTILYGPHLSSLILVGDERQLWPKVFSAEAAKAKYARSLFTRLFELGFAHEKLVVQYREGSDIAKLASSRFYDRLISVNDVASSEIIKEKKVIIERELLDCVWKIEFSDRCRKIFLKMSVPELKKVLQRIFGIFSDGYSKKYNTGYSYKLYENFIRVISLGSNVILWTVSVNVEFSCQSIKLWDFCERGNVDRMKRLITNALNQYSDNYIQLCSKIFMEDSAKILPEAIKYIGEECWIRKSIRSSKDTSDFHESSVDLIKTYSLSSIVYDKMMDRSLSDFVWDFTLSPQENKLIQEPKSLFILGRSGTGKTTIAVRKMVFLHQNMIQNNIDCDFRQLYVTSSRRLADSVNAEFIKYTRGKNLDIRAYNSSTIPSLEKIKEVSSTMLSFFDLLLLLDKCASSPFFRYSGSTSDRYMREMDASLKKDGYEASSGQVDSKIFHIFYYPHFNQALSKLADSLTLWTEFFSVIKGSEPSVLTHGRLSLENYLSLASSRVSAFSEEERGLIYSGFLRYESMKQDRNEWDMMDFCHHVQRNLSSKCPIKFEKVYLDEVQDLNLFQISLFSILGKHKDSFLFGGDTAQTIASGVSFRFENIRALFYDVFLPALEASQMSANVAPLNHLSVNYRSHNGILSLAQIVVNMIVYFFPHGIDKLDPEVGLISGSPPIFVQTTLDSLLPAVFASKKDPKSLSFNANQVIIVRDMKTKRLVEDLSQQRALVLTISESKGLEFDFVILYDFFSASTFDSWRVLLGFSEDYDGSYTRFECRKHSQLETELKKLYVAITRSKSNLWIIESNDCAKSDPMLLFWGEFIRIMSLNSLIQDVSENSFFLTLESTDADWIQRADSLFEKHLYKEAKRFYINGNCLWKAIFMDALNSREEALKMSGTAARKLNIDAAKSFAKIKKWKESGDSYFDAQEYKLAAESFLKLPDDDMLLSAIIMCYFGRLTNLCLEILDKRKFRYEDPEENHKNIKSKRDEMCKKFALYEYERGHMRQFELFLNHIESLDERRRILKRYNQYDLLIQLETAYYDKYGKVSSFLPAAYKAKRDLQSAAKFFGILGDLNAKAECLLLLLRQHLLLHWLNAFAKKEFYADLEANSPLDKSHLPIFSDLEALDKKKLTISICLEIEIWREFFQRNRLEGYVKLYESNRFTSNLYLIMLLSVFIACRTNVEELDFKSWSKTALDFISSFQTNYLALISQLNDFSKPGAYTNHVRSFFAIEGSDSFGEILFARTEGSLIKHVWKDFRKSETTGAAFEELKRKSEDAFLSSLRVWSQLLYGFVFSSQPNHILNRVAEGQPAEDFSDYTRKDLRTRLTLVRLLKHWNDRGMMELQKIFQQSVTLLMSSLLRPSFRYNPAIVAEVRHSFLGKEVVECCQFKLHGDFLSVGKCLEQFKTNISSSQYKFSNKKKIQECSHDILLKFLKSVATPPADKAKLYSYFKPIFGKISDDEMYRLADSCRDFANLNDKLLIQFICMSLVTRNFSLELFSNALCIKNDVLPLKDSVLCELSPPKQGKSFLVSSFQQGVEFLNTRIPGVNINWAEYITLIERMTYLVLVLEFKLNNIKISKHIFYSAYADYWPSILAHCNQKGFYKSWKWTYILAEIIIKVLTKQFDSLLVGDKTVSKDTGIAEATLRFVKVYLHLYNHFHTENNYAECPIKGLLSKHRGSIYQSLIKTRPNQNSHLMLIGQKFRMCVFDSSTDGIIMFFKFFEDDLLLLSSKSEYWRPWMRSYSRYIVNENTELVQVFENKSSVKEKLTIAEDAEEIEMESISDAIEEIVTAELLLAPHIIQKMRQWAKRVKQGLFNLDKVSTLPVWDKKRIETETRSLFRKSHFNLEPKILQKYLDESLSLMSRIQYDLHDINNCLQALEFDKIKQEFPDVHEDKDHLHEYKDLLDDQNSQIALTKSLLESDIKEAIAKAWNSINTYCDSHDTLKRIKSLTQKISVMKLPKSKKRNKK